MSRRRASRWLAVAIATLTAAVSWGVGPLPIAGAAAPAFSGLKASVLWGVHTVSWDPSAELGTVTVEVGADPRFPQLGAACRNQTPGLWGATTLKCGSYPPDSTIRILSSNPAVAPVFFEAVMQPPTPPVFIGGPPGSWNTRVNERSVCALDPAQWTGVAPEFSGTMPRAQARTLLDGKVVADSFSYWPVREPLQALFWPDRADLGKRIQCEITVSNAEFGATTVIVSEGFIARPGPWFDPDDVMVDLQSKTHPGRMSGLTQLRYRVYRNQTHGDYGLKPGRLLTAKGRASGANTTIDFRVMSYGSTRGAAHGLDKSWCTTLATKEANQSRPERPHGVLSCGPVRNARSRGVVALRYLAYARQGQQRVILYHDVQAATGFGQIRVISSRDMPRSEVKAQARSLSRLGAAVTARLLNLTATAQ